MIDRFKYLQRIKYEGSIDVSLDVLSMLQKSHLLAVPFENLDIHLGKIIQLENTFDKVVNKQRGGFCYELNWLFYQLLNEIRFEVKLISARVFEKEKGFGPEFDHMAIIATVHNIKYLVDVGFGEFAFAPLEIESRLLQKDQRGKYLIKPHDKEFLCVSKINGRNSVPEYIFSEITRELHEFNEMLNYHQANSNSHFTQKRLCSLPTANGRITITDNILKIKEGDTISESQLKSEEEFTNALWDYFEIKL